jgi:hypothetical protein
MNKPKKKQPLATRQSKTTQTSAPQQIHDIPRSGPAATVTPTHEDIARRAYEIYAEKGHPQGQSEQIWLQAEQDIRTRDSSRQFKSKSPVLNATRS